MASFQHSETGAIASSSDWCGTIELVGETESIIAFVLEGEFDMSVSPQVLEHAERVVQSKKHLIIDLTKATFIDSSMVRALFTASRAAQEHGRCFVLQFGSAKGVERVLEITGADKALPIAATREDAVDLIERDS